MTESSLLSTWAVCGIAAAAARFLPVPLLDELLAPLWGEPDGRPSGLRRRLRALPARVLLFPLRKYRALFGAVRGVPTDVMRVVLLARTVERRLEHGELRDRDRLPDQSRALRRAVDEAIDGMDLRLLTAALADGLSQTRGLSASAVAFARRRAQADPEVQVDPDGPIADGAQRVTEVLRRPEITSLLERFDREVDGRLSPAGS